MSPDIGCVDFIELNVQVGQSSIATRTAFLFQDANLRKLLQGIEINKLRNAVLVQQQHGCSSCVDTDVAHSCVPYQNSVGMYIA